MGLEGGTASRGHARSRQPGRPGSTLTPGLAARRTATAILRKVVEGRVPLDPLIDNAGGHRGFRALDARDQALVRALLNTALRHRGEIEFALSQTLNKRLKEDSGALSAILHIGAAQVLFLEVADHAAVDLAVSSCKTDRRTGQAAGLVNSVLRRIARERDDMLTRADVADNAPRWMRERWVAHHGNDTAKAIARAHARRAPLDLTPRNDPDTVASMVGGTVLSTGSVRLAAMQDVTELPGFAAGHWWVQDAAAALPCRLLGDVRGQRIADLCAAPGGKTAQLAAAGAQVMAVDQSDNRIRRLGDNLKRLGLSADCVISNLFDIRPEEPFDAVLLDAPCTATGTIRRHPDISWLKDPDDIATLAALQARMLQHAGQLVARGGVLVYCTCSLEPEEGEAQIAQFLARHPEFLRDPVRPQEVAGLSRLINADGDLRTLPCYTIPPRTDRAAGNSPAEEECGSEDAGIDGFFAARLVRQ